MRRAVTLPVTLALVGGASLAAGGLSGPATALSTTSTTAGAPHVMVVMMENESASELIGNANAPNVNTLAKDYGQATKSYAIGHPSLPNYLELLSGSIYGVTDDGTPSSEGIASGAQTLVNQLAKAGISWKAYMQSMPSAGYKGGDSTCCGGQYYQHHNPFVYFPAITSMAGFSSDMVPSTTVMSDLNSATPPSFVWMTPNGADDMHDGQTSGNGDVNPSVGDAWLGNFVSQVQSTSWYSQGGTIVVEWDEGNDADSSGVGNAGEGGGGHVATLVINASLKAHPQKVATPVNTAGILRSIEGVYRLPYLADAADSGNGNIDSLLSASTAPQPAITNKNRAGAVTASPFSFLVTTTGTPTPRIRKTGKLPRGLHFHNNHNGTATISGTPRPKVSTGNYTVTIVAVYGKGRSRRVVTQLFTLTVAK